MAMCAPTYEQPLCAMNHCSKCLGWETSMIGEGGAHVIKSSESPHHPRGPKCVPTSKPLTKISLCREILRGNG